MRRFDLELLTTHLSNIEPLDSLPPEGVNHYLASLLLSPSSDKEPVLLGNIDFDAFEESDLPAFEQYCDNMSARSRQVTQLGTSMVRIAPIPLRQCQFC
ncbi:hypothetical protein RFF05_13945 [Bengtsoniella intestinalis]|uniref:hypothetical protein n=1 Tax=Bengtsoniella intestinalis TaxID=3073143 RepID=UPI00391F92B9